LYERLPLPILTWVIMLIVVDVTHLGQEMDLIHDPVGLKELS